MGGSSSCARTNPGAPSTAATSRCRDRLELLGRLPSEHEDVPPEGSGEEAARERYVGGLELDLGREVPDFLTVLRKNGHVVVALRPVPGRHLDHAALFLS